MTSWRRTAFKIKHSSRIAKRVSHSVLPSQMAQKGTLLETRFSVAYTMVDNLRAMLPNFSVRMLERIRSVSAQMRPLLHVKDSALK